MQGRGGVFLGPPCHGYFVGSASETHRELVGGRVSGRPDRARAACVTNGAAQPGYFFLIPSFSVTPGLFQSPGQSGGAPCQPQNSELLQDARMCLERKFSTHVID